MSMKKINTRADLAAVKAKYRDRVLMRLISEEPSKRVEVLVGMADCGIKAGAKDTLNVFFEEVNKSPLENVSVIAVDCMGACDLEPMVEIKFPDKENVRYKNVDAALAKEIVSGHLVGGKVVDRAKV